MSSLVLVGSSTKVAVRNTIDVRAHRACGRSRAPSRNALTRRPGMIGDRWNGSAGRPQQSPLACMFGAWDAAGNDPVGGLGRATGPPLSRLHQRGNQPGESAGRPSKPGRPLRLTEGPARRTRRPPGRRRRASRRQCAQRPLQARFAGESDGIAGPSQPQAFWPPADRRHPPDDLDRRANRQVRWPSSG